MKKKKREDLEINIKRECEHMNRKHKAYIKINIISLFFIAISSVSVTLAWFAYSGLSRVTTEIDIKAWLIEFEKGDSTVSNNISPLGE